MGMHWHIRNVKTQYGMVDLLRVELVLYSSKIPQEVGRAIEKYYIESL